MKKFLPQLAVTVLSGLALTGSVIALSLSWFAAPGGTTDKETLDGEVGLRGYFYAGNGTSNNPFEIVSPIHFYNLTRLQNLGVFSLQKTYFTIGHVFDANEGPKCINTIDGDTSYDSYLDMYEFCHTNNNKLLPIGGEGAPFIGSFDGQGIPIKNLVVAGYPEDIGVFGYVSYEGSIEGLVCENLEIYSLGYTSQPSDDSTELFSQDVDNVFTTETTQYLAHDTTLHFYDNNDAVNREKLLKRLNGLNPVGLENINSDLNKISPTSYVYNGYFLPTFPTNSNPNVNLNFTYSWKSSSSLLRQATAEDKTNGLTITDAEIPNAVVIDMTALADSSSDISQNGFNCGKDMQVDARLSLIASVQIAGFTYSRVIQSYKVEFYSNSTGYDEGEYSLSIFCDYVDQGVSSDHITNYHHGNNIGFLAGHVDGSIVNSFVYKGKLHMNSSNSCHEIYTESETGLVGEIGTNVVNHLDPDWGLTTHGDTGIMNFTKIYSLIRDDVQVGDTVDSGYAATANKSYISYQNYRKTGTNGSFNLFKDYLRHMENANGDYITYTTKSMNKSGVDPLWHPYTITDPVDNSFNSVDFLWNQIIEDENMNDDDYTNDINRGLGVFKITSSYNAAAKTEPYGSHLYDNMGECYINRTKPKDKVYFSTAEYNHTISDQDAWGPGADQIEPLRATTIPSYSDEKSFDYRFERDYNYVFELNLADMNKTGGKNYMYNTDSPFLANYLKSKLIDKYGGSINPGNPRFGFMFRSSENELYDSLSYYMSLGVPGSKQDLKGDGRYYPTNSIVFKIENENGANVSIVANGGDLSIYGFDSSTSEGGKTKMYTMKSANLNNNDDDLTGHATDIDKHRYFTYDVASGETGTETVEYGAGEEETTNMRDGGCLYAHIFKLPKGEYCIGASSNDKNTNVFFLAVQGQTNASIGDNTLAGGIGGAITDVDFLLSAPTKADFDTGSLQIAGFTFSSEFDDTRSTLFDVDVKTFGDDKYLSLTFIDNPKYVTYLLLVSREDIPYYINDVQYDRAQFTYPRT